MKTEKTITQIFEESERNNASRPMGNEIESSQSKSIYRDGKEYGGKTNYVQYDSIILDIMDEKNISEGAQNLFTYILSQWDNPTISNYYTKPVEISLNYFAQRKHVSKSTIKSRIDELVNAKFIIPTYKAKGGKKPSSYIPNVDYIHQLEDEYYKKIF